MKPRLCYAWFGKFADHVRAGGGAPGEVELPTLPETEARASLTHDGRNWKFIYPPASAAERVCGEESQQNP